jgi:hypothetical protein
MRAVCALVLIALLVDPTCLLADAVILKTGERHDGKLANRELFRSDPRQFTSVTLILESEGDELNYTRFELADISIVVLEDNGVREFFDIEELLVSVPPQIETHPGEGSESKRDEGSSRRKDTGLGFMVVGSFASNFIIDRAPQEGVIVGMKLDF